MNQSSDDNRVPLGWAMTKLGNVATINPRKPKYSDLGSEQLVGFVPMTAVDADSGTVTKVEPTPLAEVRDKSYRTFATNDVLFAKITPCMENGKSAVVPALPNDRGFGSTEFHVLRPFRGLDPMYLWQFVRQQSYRDEAEGHMTGSVGQLRVPLDFLRDTSFPLPPLPEQRRIVGRLRKIDARREATASHLDGARRIAERFRRAVLSAACSGRLTADWREDHPDSTSEELLTMLLEDRPLSTGRRTSAQNGHGLTSEAQLALLPDTWSLVRLGDIIDVATGATPLRKNRDYYEDGTIPWVTSGAVNAGTITAPTQMITPLALAETNVKVFPPGTLLVAMYGEGQTRGRVAELAIEAGTNQAVAAVLFNAETAPLQPFIRAFFEDSYQRVRALSIGGVQPNLNLGMIKATLIPLPPLEEQHEIVRRADAMVQAADGWMARVDHTASALERTSRASLAKAFRGELVPTEASLAEHDGHDFESADELLARVGTTRPAKPAKREARG